MVWNYKITQYNRSEDHNMKGDSICCQQGTCDVYVYMQLCIYVCVRTRARVYVFLCALSNVSRCDEFMGTHLKSWAVDGIIHYSA